MSGMESEGSRNSDSNERFDKRVNFAGANTRIQEILTSSDLTPYVCLMSQETLWPRDDTISQWVDIMTGMHWLPIEPLCDGLLQQQLDRSAMASLTTSWVLGEAYNVRRLGLGTPYRMALLARSASAHPIEAYALSSQKSRLKELMSFLRGAAFINLTGAPEPHSVAEIFPILVFHRYSVENAYNWMDRIWGIEFPEPK